MNQTNVSKRTRLQTPSPEPNSLTATPHYPTPFAQQSFVQQPFAHQQPEFSNDPLEELEDLASYFRTDEVGSSQPEDDEFHSTIRSTPTSYEEWTADDDMCWLECLGLLACTTGKCDEMSSSDNDGFNDLTTDDFNDGTTANQPIADVPNAPQLPFLSLAVVDGVEVDVGGGSSATFKPAPAQDNVSVDL